MIHTHLHPERWAVNISIVLATCGTFLFAYGIFMTSPKLRTRAIPPPVSVSMIASPHSSAPTPLVPPSVFFAGSILLVSPLTFDVCRRLGSVKV